MKNEIMSGPIKIKIKPRYVKEDNGLRPFQKETLEVIKNSDSKIIFGAAQADSFKYYQFKGA